jgi:ABC-type oligopeptide transport system substrate-binding subunit
MATCLGLAHVIRPSPLTTRPSPFTIRPLPFPTHHLPLCSFLRYNLPDVYTFFTRTCPRVSCRYPCERARACGVPPAAQTIARELQLNLGNEPATLDPALATDPPAQQVLRMLFLSLVDTDPATGAPQHALATSWAVSPDGLVWEFKLRADALWVRYNPANDRIESQRAVTADDVVYSVRRVFDPRVGSGFAATFAPLLRGAAQLRAADPKKTSDATFEQLFAALGVQAMDATTVRFTLTQPASYFPSIVSAWLVRTQPREAIEEHGVVWTEPGKIWTNGPYVLERWSHGRQIVLRKNDLWYDASIVRLTRIRLAMIPDTTTALEQYRQGQSRFARSVRRTDRGRAGACARRSAAARTSANRSVALFSLLRVQHHQAAVQ